MSVNFHPDNIRFNFDEFYTRFYPKLVDWFVGRGMRREEAEEHGQEICLAIYQSSDDITDADGWGYIRARWALIDWYRRGRVAKEQPLVTRGDDGDKVEANFPSDDPKIELAIDVRARMDRHWASFLRLFEQRAEGYKHVVRAVKVLVHNRAPGDKVSQFRETHQLVFTGIGDDKRDSDDVRILAEKLKMTTGALRTAFTRLQLVWGECASETYLKGIYRPI